MPRRTPSAPVPAGPDEPLFYTAAEVARLLCVSERTVRLWRAKGRMTGPLGVHVGRRLLYPRADVHTLAAQLAAGQRAEDGTHA